MSSTKCIPIPLGLNVLIAYIEIEMDEMEFELDEITSICHDPMLVK